MKRLAVTIAFAGLALVSTAALAADRGGWERERIPVWPQEYANPDIVRVAGGGWRAYLMSPDGIVSAYSADGLSFAIEPGLRIAGHHHALMRLPDGRLRIFYSTVEGGGVLSAVSEDGLDFVREEGVRLAEKPKDRPIHPHVVRARGGWRMYYDADGGSAGGAPNWRGIRSAFSEDGLDFKRERGWRIRTETEGLRSASLVWSPFAERRGRKTDLLFSVETHRRPEKLAGIWRARSKDGLDFTALKGPELGIDPAVTDPAPGPGGLSGLPQDPFVIDVGSGERLFYWQARAGNFTARR